MTHFACLNMKTVKARELPAILHHNAGYRAALENVDASKTRLNETSAAYLEPKLMATAKKALGKKTVKQLTLETVKKTLPTLNKQGNKMRKDARIAMSFVFQASHGWAGDNDQFFADAKAWVSRYLQGEVAHWSIHKDEKTPHMHVIFVPKDAEGRANYYAQLGGAKPAARQKLKALQDSYFAEVGEPHGLARGKSREQREVEGTVKDYGGGSRREREERLKKNKQIEEAEAATALVEKEREIAQRQLARARLLITGRRRQRKKMSREMVGLKKIIGLEETNQSWIFEELRSGRIKIPLVANILQWQKWWQQQLATAAQQQQPSAQPSAQRRQTKNRQHDQNTL